MTPEAFGKLSADVIADKTFIIGRITDAKGAAPMHPDIKKEANMAEINLDGKAPEGITERVKLEDKSRHIAELADCRVQEVSDYDNPNKKVNRLIIDWTVNNQVIPMWANPKVSKGSGTFSNSKVYDVLKALKQLEAFAEKFAGKTQISDEELSNFIAGLAGTKAEIQIRNTKVGTEDEYSNIGDVIKLAG